MLFTVAASEPRRQASSRFIVLKAPVASARHREYQRELAILTDRRSARITQLLEAMRHDHPRLRDRIDRLQKRNAALRY